MKQVLQSLASGEVRSEEVPAPGSAPGHLLIETRRSLVSSGTERMLLEFGRSNWIDKARSQPEKVRQVLDKARTDGVKTAYEAVRSKLDQPLSLGYSNMGVVREVGAGVRGFAVGDRVISNGKHAEVVSVPQNLCARVPDAVADDAAAFAVLGAIGLEGIRLAAPSLGECVVVTGLGLIGLLTVQLLRAQGCRVLGLDFDAARLELGAAFGAQVVDLSACDPLPEAQAFSRGRGVDAVLITAATKSAEPVRQGARMCRQRGRIVLVGVAGLELERADFYDKELSFQVSCSYGPGRYDPQYEQGGHDYPVGFVRWTEQRNFEAVLDLMAAGSLDPSRLISHRFEIACATQAYDLLAGSEPSLGVLLDYPGAPPGLGARRVYLGSGSLASAPARVAFIGTGNYASRVLIPAFQAAGAGLHTAVSQLGVSAAHQGRKFGFQQATTDIDAALDSPEVDSVVIATRHSSHASLALRALAANKHLFVEKPLCTSLAELEALEAELAQRPQQCLMVGFNRRFAPLVVKLESLLAPLREPRAMVMTVNAGALPRGHWLSDPDVGGGRILGEACHYIDLLRHLAGSPIQNHAVQKVGAEGATLTLDFESGSSGAIHYFTEGHRSFPKERLEVFCAGRVLVLDNFKSLVGHGVPGFSRQRSLVQDKGQAACVRAFVEAVRSGGMPPITREELLEVSRVSILAQQAVGSA
jgi:predicted dehydrogenase/threonine dehydrogenase-like Zn-dependent dehydrogenase